MPADETPIHETSVHKTLVHETERILAGRYRLQAVIGRGGMGAVWRARDELLNRNVAIKEIVWPDLLDPAERETARRRAVREAQMAARLSHPNVVGVYDILEEDGRPCIVMELVPFRSLRDVLAEDGPLSPPEAARVGLGVLAALSAVHEAGVVHRDVKPANILLGPEDRVVLADFGIAKAADSPALTASGVLLGSPSYLAPERARGGRADTASDLWALGASLYGAVEGRPPFERDSVIASLTAVVADEPEPAPRAGPLWPVIEGLLRKDPAVRLDAAGAERMLRRIASADPAEAAVSADATPPTPPTPPAPPAGAAEATAADQAVGQGRRAGSRSRKARAIALAAVAVIAVVAAGIAMALGRHPGHPAARPAPPAASRSVPSTTPSSAPPSTPSPASSAQASSAQASSAPASSAPASSGSSALPAGYYRFTNATGFSIGVPRGWQISHDGHYVYIRDPANSGIFLLIDQSDQPKSNPLADWRQQAADRQGSYPGYHLILLREVRYTQAEKAADWEFTYDRNGVRVQVLNRNILANARHAYALYWSTPVSDWDAFYHYFQAFAATFRPAPAS
ncbi:MAG TPA: serine/threonine-protein kinase [Streptosporangiaceae bacterium]|jgi:serine/threonine protein kinase